MHKFFLFSNLRDKHSFASLNVRFEKFVDMALDVLFPTNRLSIKKMKKKSFPTKLFNWCCRKCQINLLVVANGFLLPVLKIQQI